MNLDKSNESKTDNDPSDNDLRATVVKEMALGLAARWNDTYPTAPKE